MDQFGNKYYEDFDAIRKNSFIQISTNAAGSNSTITFLSAVPTETWFLPSGTGGWRTSMTTSPHPTATASTIPFSRNPTIGIHPVRPLRLTLPEQLLSILLKSTTKTIEWADMPKNGRQRPKGNDEIKLIRDTCLIKAQQNAVCSFFPVFSKYWP